MSVRKENNMKKSKRVVRKLNPHWSKFSWLEIQPSLPPLYGFWDATLGSLWAEVVATLIRVVLV